jgi:hypothetical protein
LDSYHVNCVHKVGSKAVADNPVDRLTIQDAARRLGVSEGAVRKRVARGTLEHDKEESGRVYVYLPAGVDDGVDGGQDEGVDPNSSALISHLEEEISYLRDENRRKDEIIMQQAMTMRALSAPEEPENVAAPRQSEEPPEDTESPENSILSRLFRRWR